ncbi:adenylate cyclase [Entomophthora muscae]|uniref:Adenylate cyclase n=1 Tax=Entomophthora muscae TaxID=34485 RepID=A0ACC2UIX9_9FUNG|nr:adenylate cyclase [Entomophthora muscae]
MQASIFRGYLLLLVWLVYVGVFSSRIQSVFSLEDVSSEPKIDVPLKKLRKYIQINTSNPSPKYEEAMDFLAAYASEIGLDFKVVRCAEGDPPTGIMTWKGQDPKVPSILLNSHTDVVPANAADWEFDPFNATLSVDKEGKSILVGRGSQDCKSLGIMYLEAIRNIIGLFPEGPQRTIQLSFVPDEETGGDRGLRCLAESPEFSKIFPNIGLVFDEGFLNDGNDILAFYSERVQRGFKITAKGNSGHASQFITDLATDKIMAFAAKARLFRFQENRRMENHGLQLGDVSTINLDIIKVGSALNVVPGVAEAWFDLRVTPLADIPSIEKMLFRWASESDVKLEFKKKDEPHSTNATSNAFWSSIQETANELNLPLKLAVFPAATDSRHLRKLGIPAIGLTPINQHPIQAHAIDESIRLKAFYKGIKFYTKLLPRLASFK